MIKTSDMAEVEKLQAEGKKVVAISGGSPQVFTIDDGIKEKPEESKVSVSKKNDKRGKK